MRPNDSCDIVISMLNCKAYHGMPTSMHQSDVRYDEREEETGRTEKIPETKQE